MYNVNQMMGLTGRRFRPSWDAYYAEKAKSLPNMMALANQKQYNDKMSGLEEDRMRLQENYYDKQQDNMKTGNWINTASLGLQGLNTANQLAGGDLVGSVAKHAGDAWDAISEGFSSLWA